VTKVFNYWTDLLLDMTGMVTCRNHLSKTVITKHCMDFKFATDFTKYTHKHFREMSHFS